MPSFLLLINHGRARINAWAAVRLANNFLCKLALYVSAPYGSTPYTSAPGTSVPWSRLLALQRIVDTEKNLNPFFSAMSELLRVTPWRVGSGALRCVCSHDSRSVITRLHSGGNVTHDMTGTVEPFDLETLSWSPTRYHAVVRAGSSDYLMTDGTLEPLSKTLSSAWSNDGNRLALVQFEKNWMCIRVYVFDGKRFEFKWSFGIGSEPVLNLAWSPISNTRLAVCQRAAGTGVIDVETKHWDPLDTSHCVAWSSQNVLVTGRQKVLTVWSESGGLLAQWGAWMHHGRGCALPQPCDKLAWSPDGTLLAWCGDNGAGILRWDGNKLMPMMELQSGTTFRDIAWSPDGRMLAACAGTSVLRVTMCKYSRHTHHLFSPLMRALALVFTDVLPYDLVLRVLDAIAAFLEK
jgi:WD40 repeat protein